jgi:tetratricopeptide (TPR) repeat protein
MLCSRRFFLPLVVLAYLVSYATAQNRTGDIRVRITFSDGLGCNTHAHLILISGGGTHVLETYTDSQCMAAFDNLAVGNYHVIVSGGGLQETDSGLFEVDERKSGQYLFVAVKSVGEVKRAQPTSDATVSATALKIPPNAAKEFDKANKLIAKEDWVGAKENLEKALAIYPQYAAAYNNLGVVEGRMGNSAGEQENLQKAVSLDEHFAPAYVNLGKLSIKQHDLAGAEGYFTKAISAGSSDAATLTLLANTQLLNRHFNKAITTCREVHEGPQAPHVLCHYIAARAMAHENRLGDAKSELAVFLAEEPSGARADEVRKEMAALPGH